MNELIKTIVIYIDLLRESTAQFENSLEYRCPRNEKQFDEEEAILDKKIMEVSATLRGMLEGKVDEDVLKSFLVSG